MKILLLVLNVIIFPWSLICVVESKNIMEVLETDNDRFSMLLQVINLAGFADTLKNGLYTFLAPTNTAFSSLSKDVLDELFSNTSEMKTLLSTHIADGVFFLSDLTKMVELMTIDGDMKNVTNDGSINMVGNSTIIQTDMKADNGVVHAIGTVLQTTK
ncbi:transforming growth factor-beta-induced protein ig-h3-like [Daphnia pulex]|uniref:transforming growth factor-beta-induced protein ig-h3-like n=1 Tax=Daphnia pulex TaxID=6669 RepID=UPI001EDFE247|nr:transforming growth factor-beta-induced protein ig-h3-like [Daphnia pulex]